jgi:hypothetical protein
MERMERKKRERRLAESPGSALSFLDQLVTQEADRTRPKGPNEFTAADYVAALKSKGVTISIFTARRRLDNLLGKGVLTSRVIPLDGNACRVYKEATT